jgi:hypothetical protein
MSKGIAWMVAVFMGCVLWVGIITIIQAIVRLLQTL